MRECTAVKRILTSYGVFALGKHGHLRMIGTREAEQVMLLPTSILHQSVGLG